MEHSNNNKDSTRNWTTFHDSTDSRNSSELKQPTALLEPVELSELKAPNAVSTTGILGVDTAKNDVVPVSANQVMNANGTQDKSQKGAEVVLTVSQTIGALNEATNGQEATKSAKLLTTIYPVNMQCAWITRPHYDLKMPPILGGPPSALPTNVYADLMRTIQADIRFFSYTLLYSRMVPVWLIFSIIILLAVLASSPMGGIPVMVFAFVWLFLLIFGLLLCALLQKYIVLSLRNLVKELNMISQSYHLLVGIQDRGILFFFYDFDGCREDIARQLRVHRANSLSADNNTILSDIEVSRTAEALMLAHSQAYVKALIKNRLRFPSRPSEGVSEFMPKHVAKSYCLCQFVASEHFNRALSKSKVPWYERLFAV